MFLVIISVALSVVLFVFLGLKEEGYSIKFALNKKQILSILPLFLILFQLIAVIPANHVGILYSPVSGVREETIPEGWNKKGLLDKVYKINTEVQSKVLEGVSGQTKDSQYITMKIDVKYKVDTTTAYQVFKQYRDLENVSNSFIAPTVQRSIETVTTSFNIMDILGTKRNDVYLAIEKDLKERLASSGITFVSINFIDTDAGEAMEKAIEQQGVAKKAVETAEQDRLKAEIEAQKSVVTAKAEKEAAIIKAETRRIEAEAEADVNRKMAESITPLVIQRMEMQARLKWGWVTVQGGTPIVDARQ